MCCLKFNMKLFQASNAWKLFTKKVQSKFYKLHKSKSIKKHKNGFNKPSKRICWPTLGVQRRNRFKPKPKLSYQIHHFQKRPSAVYIDQLFNEPAITEHVHPSIKEYKKETPSSSGSKDHQQQQEESTASAADEMWESLEMGSPHMNGIDDRAEEFITKFRADMRLQEQIIARRL